MSGSIDQSLMDLFRMEAESQTAVLADGILILEGPQATPAVVEGLMRAAHSLKGAARIVGLEPAVRVAHVLEDYFVALQKLVVRVAPGHVDLLLRGVDLLHQITQWLDGNADGWMKENQGAIDDYAGRLKAVIAGQEAESIRDALPTPPAPKPQVMAVAPQPVPTPAVAGPEPVPLSALQATTKSEPPAPGTDPRAVPSSKGAATGERSDRVVRVAAESLSRLMGLAGESLVESRQFPPFIQFIRSLRRCQTDLFSCLRTIEEQWKILDGRTGAPVLESIARAKAENHESLQLLDKHAERFEELAYRSEDLAGRLHHEVIASRMRPLADGIRGFPRLVRDLAKQLGKEARFEIHGEQTGVDRDILEKLEAPLNHILRNAIDHGLESPDERTRVGKDRTGLIRLEACHRAGMLQITIRDDGHGIDFDGLRGRIVERGLEKADVVERLEQDELLAFLFLPGFSTRESVTEISGRGVGLDVVQEMVRSVGGTIKVGAVPGRECSFSLRLPISRSIIRALLVSIEEETYAFPLTRIVRIERLSPDRIHWLESKPYFDMEDLRKGTQTVGLVEAAQVLELRDVPREGWVERNVVVVGDSMRRFGLVVDQIKEERDLDVRPLDPRLGKVPNLGSASVLEDGSPVLIFDVDDLVESIENMIAGRRLKGPSAALMQRRATKRILVVDDSITVRERERQVLMNRGFVVDVAVDGMDAWNAVRGVGYDLVVTDVDMPRMDGIELVRRIRSDPRLRTMPVIVVSYKDRKEDRDRGLEAGADQYLTKSSFENEAFVKAIINLVGEA